MYGHKQGVKKRNDAPACRQRRASPRRRAPRRRCCRRRSRRAGWLDATARQRDAPLGAPTCYRRTLPLGRLQGSTSGTPSAPPARGCTPGISHCPGVIRMALLNCRAKPAAPSTSCLLASDGLSVRKLCCTELPPQELSCEARDPESDPGACPTAGAILAQRPPVRRASLQRGNARRASPQVLMEACCPTTNVLPPLTGTTLPECPCNLVEPV